MNQTASYVCAHYPQHPEEVGALVLTPSSVAKDQAYGAVYLPATPRLFTTTHLAIGGFVRRSWGRPGWYFSTNRPEAGSPIALSVEAGQSTIHWAAGVVPMRHEDGASGKLQLASNRGIPGGVSNYHVIEAADAFQIPPDKQKLHEHIIRGSVGLNLLVDGTFAAHLWGIGHGIYIRWVAMAQEMVGE